ncbi:class I SAM-dependent methyltransferase [Streptomyces sp. NPDC004327]|uniref:class I SAM-dependent methyltransferase n=1 Tax=unclassified Streptomyces TaxID=2593676 RepID=UPI0036CC76F4
MAAIPPRFAWALTVLDLGPDDRVLEIGCGSGAAAALVCERLSGGSGHIVAIDRSARATALARRRLAARIAAGRAEVRTLPLLDLAERHEFDAAFAFNVNVLWTRSPDRELAVLERVLVPGGALHLFFGYGQGPADRSAQVAARTAAALTAYGFATRTTASPYAVCVSARMPV